MTYIQILEKITKDILTDLSSLRVWLIILGFIFNGSVLWLVAFHGMDYKVAISAIALLTCIYGFFFASKHTEAIINSNAVSTVDDEPPADDRDPSKIDPDA